MLCAVCLYGRGCMLKNVPRVQPISGTWLVCCVQANDIYLEMAIGNAPWPIGVTMVGIHARTGREKIFAQNVARILSEKRPCMQPGCLCSTSKLKVKHLSCPRRVE